MPRVRSNDIPINKQGLKYNDYDEPSISYDPYPDTTQPSRPISPTERTRLNVSNFFVNLVVSALIITILGIAVTTFPVIAILATTIVLCFLTRR